MSTDSLGIGVVGAGVADLSWTPLGAVPPKGAAPGCSRSLAGPT